MKKLSRKAEHIQKPKNRASFVTAFVFLAVIYVLFLGMIFNHSAIGAAFSKQWQKQGKNITALDDALKAAESKMNQSILGRTTWINVHGLFQKVLNRRWIGESKSYNDVYKMDNGQLTYAYPDYNVSGAAKQYKKLYEYCRQQGTALLYVQWPYKVNKYDNQLPHNMEDYSNQNCDKFLSKLAEFGADTLDYREVLHASGQEYASLFFDTDHHWKTETAFDAYRYLLTFFQESYGFSFDERLLSKENYSFVTLPQSFIGSLANRSGIWYAGVDDFTYIVPTFDTNFIWEKYAPSGKKLASRKGSFDKTVLFENALTQPEQAKPYRDNCYFNGNPALAKISNQNVENGRILCVVDSYSKPVAALLSLAFHQLDFMDLRDFTKLSLIEYLEENEYDYILVAYSAAAFKKTTAAKFFNFK